MLKDARPSAWLCLVSLSLTCMDIRYTSPPTLVNSFWHWDLLLSPFGVADHGPRGLFSVWSSDLGWSLNLDYGGKMHTLPRGLCLEGVQRRVI